jgi:hypothetical protein
MAQRAINLKQAPPGRSQKKRTTARDFATLVY